MLTKLFHIILAALVLISSTGLVLSKHYCGGELKSTAIFAEATPCHQDKRMKHCPVHGMMMVADQKVPTEKGCCDTETDFLKAEDEQVRTSVEFTLADQAVLFTVLIAFSDFAPIKIDRKTNHYLSYKPPPLVCDLPVRLQTFLC